MPVTTEIPDYAKRFNAQMDDFELADAESKNLAGQPKLAQAYTDKALRDYGTAIGTLQQAKQHYFLNEQAYRNQAKTEAEAAGIKINA